MLRSIDSARDVGATRRVFDTPFNNLNYEYAAVLSVIMFLLCSVSAAVYIYTSMKDKAWEKQE